MDANLIQTLGFPIAAVVGCAGFIVYMVKRALDEAKAREVKRDENSKELAVALNKSTEAIKDCNEINRELSETNKMLVNEMKSELNRVGTNVDKILDKVTK